ncbi:MAG: hypothetical protein R3C30_13895 [Hyphomonadaceae bacterium]
MRTLFTALATLALTSSAFAQQQPPAPSCEAAEFHAFDFWIGEWDAFRADTNAPAGRSSITSEDAGCVITEHWRSLNTPYSGRSLNIYDRESGRWEQFWVDSSGNRVHFIGGPTDTGMRVTTAAPVTVAPGQQAFSRMTFTNNPDGTVLQHGEQSADGATWTTAYAFIYRRRAAE